MVEESCYATKRGSPQSGREGNDAIVIFQAASIRRVQEWLQHTTDINLWNSLMCGGSLSRLKSKYPWLFSLRGASRCPGTDISSLETRGKARHGVQVRRIPSTTNTSSPHVTR